MYIAIKFKGQAGCVIVFMSICLRLITTLKLFIFTLNRVEEILRLSQQKIQGQVSISD